MLLIIVKVKGKNHIKPIKFLVIVLDSFLLFKLKIDKEIALTIKNITNIFSQTGRKIVGGYEKDNHIIFIPPIIEKGNRKSIPVIINLSLSSET